MFNFFLHKFANAATEAAKQLQSEQEVAEFKDPVVNPKKALAHEPNSWTLNAMKNLKKQEGWNKVPNDNQTKQANATPKDPTWYTNGINGIKNYEGFRNMPYKDTKGIATTGYGFNTKEKYLQDAARKLGINLNGQMSKEQADRLLRHTIDTVHLPSLRAMYKNYDKFPDSVKASLLDMHYNLGGPKLKKFVNMNNSLDAGDYESAARHAYASQWRKDVKDRRAGPVINGIAGRDIYSELNKTPMKGGNVSVVPNNSGMKMVPKVQPQTLRQHIIQKGDTLDAIAKRYGTTVNHIISKNPGVDPRKLQIGQRVNR